MSQGDETLTSKAAQYSIVAVRSLMPVDALAASSSREQAAKRRALFAAKVHDLAEQVVGPVAAYKPGRPLTTYAEWLTAADGSLLVVAINPDEGLLSVLETVGYALAWQHDRDLALLVSEGHADAVLERLAFIGTPVRLWSFDKKLAVLPRVIPAPDEVVAAARTRQLRGGADHDLGASTPLVTELVRAAREHWALTPAHRSGYLSWHCAGRQVLKMSRSRKGVRMQAGVLYKTPPADRPPFDKVILEPLTKLQRATAESAVAAAVADRFSGHDKANLEHLMQATLAAYNVPGPELSSFTREYPAWRGDKQAGFIDFLGLDRAGRFHVVETKIGSDVGIVLQALDYATWVKAHAAAIRADLDWPPGDDSVVHIDLLVAPKGTSPALGPYTAGQLEALAGDVSWQVHVMADPAADDPEISSFPRRMIPDPQPGLIAPPVMPARFAASVQQRLLR
jgi:hypothetical protein